MKIYKYVIDKTKINTPQQIITPFNKKFLHVAYFNNEICAWFAVNEDADTIQEPINYVVKYTGDQVQPNEQHSATVIDHTAGLVYHIFIQDRP